MKGNRFSNDSCVAVTTLLGPGEGGFPRSALKEQHKARFATLENRHARVPFGYVNCLADFLRRPSRRTRATCIQERKTVVESRWLWHKRARKVARIRATFTGLVFVRDKKSPATKAYRVTPPWKSERERERDVGNSLGACPWLSPGPHCAREALWERKCKLRGPAENFSHVHRLFGCDWGVTFGGIRASWAFSAVRGGFGNWGCGVDQSRDLREMIWCKIWNNFFVFDLVIFDNIF